MGRPFVRGVWYVATQGWLQIHLPLISSDHWTLLFGALSREFLDKTITLGFAIFCVAFFSVPPRRFSSSPIQRIQTDVASLLSFIATYAVYLCFARIYRPAIRFTGGTTSVEWLTYPTIIGLLYFPLLLAVVSFLFATPAQGTSYGRRVEASRFRRRATFIRLLSKKPWEFLRDEVNQEVAVGKRLYGLAAGVAAWPITKASGLLNVDFGLTYVGGVTAAICYYFYQNHQFVNTTQKFNAGTQTLLDWRSIGRTPAKDGSTLDLIARQFGGTCSRKFWSSSLVYVVLETTKTSVAKGDDTVNANSVLVALSIDQQGLPPEGREAIETAVREFPPDLIFLLHPNARSPALVSWMTAFWRAKTKIFLLDWAAAQEFLETLGRKDRISLFLSQLRVGARSLIIGGNPNDERGPVTYKDLAERTLPNLAHIMDRMSSGQSVLDLGAGRGRHTLYALQSNLDAISIERKQEAYLDLAAAIEAAGGKNSATALFADYTEVDIAALGRADLVISTGVLQHVKSLAELKAHLGIIRTAASRDFGNIYIEMLFDMLFDGARPTDGRISITQKEFEEELEAAFPVAEWKIACVYGPVRKLQTFRHRPRSFYPPAEEIEVTSVEYFLVHVG